MKKLIVIIFIAAAFLGNSCKSFLGVDETNPNSASQVAAKLVLPASLNLVATTMDNPRRFEFVYLWHGLWSISSGYTQPQNLVQYKLLNSNYQNIFRELYIAGKNFDVIDNGSTDAKDCYYKAISKIMKAYIFETLVDCYGNIPYSEAFKTSTGNLKPKYDDQKAIYEDLVVQLDAAMDLIANAPAGANAIPSNSDIIYGGNTALWLKFANTLKLRILVTQSDMTDRASYISTNIATTASYGYIGAGEGALSNPGYTASTGKMNPFYETFYNASATAQSDGVTYYFAGADAVNYMQSCNDPRIGKFFQTYDGTHYAGNIFGSDPSVLLAQAKTSKLGYSAGDAGTMIGTPKKSAPIFTDFEALFLEAEAVNRGIISGDAKELYESAVTESFLYMGLTSTQAINYLSQASPKMNYDNASDKKQLILTQKWVALNGVAPATIWTDFRRTGIPTILNFSPDPNIANATPPVRLLYPQDEINVNDDNLLSAMAAQSYVDEFKTKIFWQNR